MMDKATRDFVGYINDTIENIHAQECEKLVDLLNKMPDKTYTFVDSADITVPEGNVDPDTLSPAAPVVIVQNSDYVSRYMVCVAVVTSVRVIDDDVIEISYIDIYNNPDCDIVVYADNLPVGEITKIIQKINV